MLSTKLQLNNKVHNATTAGQVGECRDQDGSWAATVCGQRSAKTRPSYTDNERAVTCKKCS